MESMKEAVVIHDLLSKEISPIRNFHRWVQLWEAAATQQEMLGLLHCGFDVPLERAAHAERQYDRIDRYVYYFTIADGWCDAELLEKREEDRDSAYCVGYDNSGNRIEKQPKEIRQEIARKAFDMLAQHLFKAPLRDRFGQGFAGIWENTVLSDRLLPIIKRFWNAEPEIWSPKRFRIRNLDDRNEKSHSRDLAVDFLLNLAKFVWDWKGTPVPAWWAEDSPERKQAEKSIAAARTRIDSAKLWLIEVLAYLGKLDVLAPWILHIDAACIEKLKEIALRNEFVTWHHPVAENRLVATVDEACYMGSETALFIKRIELVQAEHKRLSDILEAEQQLKEAARNVERLTGKR